MEHKRFREYLVAAREKLVNEKILKSSILDKPLIEKNAHDADNYDWRYLSAASLFA